MNDQLEILEIGVTADGEMYLLARGDLLKEVWTSDEDDDDQEQPEPD